MHLLLWVIALAAPAHATPSFSPDALTLHPKGITLPNGLLVLVEEQHRTDTVALQIQYRVGSLDETPSELGCAHLFEHLMFEGSANVPGDAFDRWLTAGGGENNAWTSEDFTAYHETFPSGALPLGLFLESDRLGFLDAGLVQENLANQQDVVLQERAEGYAEPNGRDFDALSRLLWPEDHPYHHPVIGTVEAIEHFQLDGVRAFWQKHYRPRNAVLAIVGHLDSAVAFDAATHWFSDVPDPGPAAARAEVPWPAARTSPALGMLEDEVEQRSLYLAWRAPPVLHEDTPALDLALRILSGGQGTRLDDDLLYEHNLTSDLGAGLFSGTYGGPALIAMTSAGPSLARLQARTLAAVDRLGRRGPTEDELERAKAAVYAELASGLESAPGRAEALTRCQLEWGDPNCVVLDWQRTQVVTSEAVAQAVRTWLDRSQHAALSIVPLGDDGALAGSTPVELP